MVPDVFSDREAVGEGKLMRLCIRCGKPVYRRGQKYHYECRELSDAEFRAKIEALPETVVTDEDVRRFFVPDLTPFERQHG